MDWVALASILVEKASSQDEFTRITAIKWIKVRTRTCSWVRRKCICLAAWEATAVGG